MAGAADHDYTARREIEEAQRTLEYALGTIGTDLPDTTALLNAIQHIGRAIGASSMSKALRWDEGMGE